MPTTSRQSTPALQMQSQPNSGSAGLLQLSAPQWRFIRNTEAPVKLLSAGYGFGKTYAGDRQGIVYAAENPGCRIGMVGATWRQVDRDIVRLFDQILGDEMGVPYKYNSQKREILVPRYGWAFDLASGEEPDAIKGVTWAAAVVNEPGIQPPKIHEVVLSRLRDPRARLRQLAYVGTPEGIGNWLGKRFITKPIPGSRVIFGKTSDNPSCPAGYVDAMAGSYDAMLVQEKIYGRFVNTQSGLAYYAFRRSRNVIPGLQPVPGVLWRVALDFNVDPFIASLCQVFYGDCPLGHAAPGCIHVLREIVLHRADTQAMASAIAAAIGNQRPEETPVYPDATGRRETTAAVDGSDFALLREAGFTDLRVAPSNPRQRDRVNVANGLFCNARGEVRLVYSDVCEEGIADRETIGWHLGGLDGRDPKRTHAADGVDYMAWQEFPPGGRDLGGVVIL